jgi:hypothetical protein
MMKNKCSLKFSKVSEKAKRKCIFGAMACNIKLLRTIGVFFLFFLVSLFCYSQECKVEKESIAFEYSGQCKKGKAHGKGKASGIDSYEGEFKNGLPDGEGTYKWSNGDRYAGNFVKGFREGKGEMRYKRSNAPDSVVNGYWKKDKYVGKNEHPYIVHFKSKLIIELEVDYSKEFYNEITFFVVNTSSGATSTQGVMPRLKVDEIQMEKGSYGKMIQNFNYLKKTETILTQVILPTRMKVLMDSEELEIEFVEPGRYIISIRINK